MEEAVMEKLEKATPRMRFSGFRDNWSMRKLKDVAEIKGRIGFRGYTVSDLVPAGQGALTIGAKHIGPAGQLKLTDPTYLSWDKYHESPEIMIAPGDILFVQRGSLGMTALVDEVPEPATINPSMVIIRVSAADPAFIYQMLRGPIVQKEVEQISTATAVPMISQGQIGSFVIALPTLPEQRKVAAFLGAVDRKIQQLERKQALLEQYKKGVVQQLFSQELRFKREDGGEYPEWEERELGEVLTEHKLTSTGTEEVYSVSVHKSLINQVEHLGRVYAAETTDHYNRVLPGDIVYTKSPTGEFKYGIIKQSRLDKAVIVSPLYGVFTPETRALGYWLDAYFESIANTYNYLHPIVQKGAKNTIAVTNRTFLSNKLKLPVDHDEQEKIAGFLMALDAKVAGVAQAVAAAQQWKKGLLQQMFV
ncbi:MAG: restriction endonuclease subunit S [Flavobacteriales bacterium]|nr:restriction endonuclease subunit S [Flavobacteriales bacterium]MCB0783263.1 restriction endonuclease subunit S [Flavobacteriales bacterium]